MKRIEIKNFRAFKNKESIVFKPITLLVGPNNSGKSTIYNSLKLIKHSAPQERFAIPPVLDSKLGANFSHDSSQILNSRSKPLELHFKVQIIDGIYIDLKLQFKDLVLSHFSIEYNKKILIAEDYVDFKDFNGEEIQIFDNSFLDIALLKKLLKDYISKQLKQLEKNLNELDNLRGQWDDDFGLIDEKSKNIEEELQLTKLISSTLNSSFYELEPNEQILGVPEKEHAVIKDVLNDFEKLLNTKSFRNLNQEKFLTTHGKHFMWARENNVGDLSASFKLWDIILKFQIKQALNKSGIVKEIVNTQLFKYIDELFIPFIEKQITLAINDFTKIEKIPTFKSFKNKYIYLNEKTDSYFNEIVKYIFFLHELPPNDQAGLWFLNDWLKKFEIGTEVIPKKLNNDIGELFVRDMIGKKINIADMGFGVQQILCIIATPLKYFQNPKHYMNSDESECGGSDYGHRVDSPFLFLEEPESNLHPRWQSTLIELIVEMKRTFGIHFLIETHSEYMIRKLQYLIANNCNNISTDDVAIYYINRDQDVNRKEPKIKEIIIREDGILANSFGPGFFDEATKLTIDLLTVKNYN
jgi:predicted ATP-dependent endonuclease of OLD family